MDDQFVTIVQLGGASSSDIADFFSKGHSIQQQSISCLGFQSTIQEVFSFECLLQNHSESSESSISDSGGGVK